MKSKGKTV